MHRIGKGRHSSGPARKSSGRAKLGSGRVGRWKATLEQLEDRTVFDASLAITEVMYSPVAPQPGGPFVTDDFEFIEIQNISAQPVDLTGSKFTLGVQFTFGAQTLQPGAFAVIARNQAAFESRYGVGVAVAGVYTGSLVNAGEQIRFETAGGTVISQFSYDGAWYPITNGEGFSLVPINPSNQTQLDTANGWRPSGTVLGSPGAADVGVAPGAVIINEIISHTDLTLGDWIELRNTTNQPIDVSGWFLSQNNTDPTKFKIAAGTVIPANGYVTFTQFVDFGNAANPNAKVPFALSELGETVYLSSAGTNGLVGGYRDEVTFGAAEVEVPFGRIFKNSGSPDFVSLVSTTFGKANSYVVTSPIVINEIMYAPTTGGDEYIELYNTTDKIVTLFDPKNASNTYEFTNGITFDLPELAVVPARGYALVTALDPATFRTKYSIPANVPIYGPYVGTLNDAGEAVEISRPGNPEPDGSVPEILVDRVNYKTATPWPVGTNFTGASLSRLDPYVYGNDPLNWRAGRIGGTPGRPNFDPTISIGDAAVIEGNAGAQNVVLTVALSTFSDLPVTVAYATANNTATAGSDYDAVNGTLTFAPGAALSQQITLSVKGDSTVEPNEVFFLNLSNAVGAPLARSQATVTIENEDTPPAPANKLVISELMYNPLPPEIGSPYFADDFEFIELQNVGTQAMNITGARITLGVDFTFGAKTLAPGERVVLVRNSAAFVTRYPGVNIGGVFAGGTLNNGGEQIVVVDAASATLIDFTYNDNWYPQSDGLGYSLVNTDPINGDAKLSSSSGWRLSDALNGSPGQVETGPPAGSVLINEILASTDDPLGDWIELYNASTVAVDISGWYLSDSSTTLMKYRVPAGTIMAPKSFKVFTATEDFNNLTNPAALVPFSLSSLGERVNLTAITSTGELSGYRVSENYEPDDGEISYGRYTKSSGGVDFVALQEPTRGAANAPVKVGPVVISEIMYQPTLTGDEYIELHNISDNTVKLYDPANDDVTLDNTWSFTKGVSYTFPPGINMTPGEYVLVVAIDPAAFRAKYAIPADVQIFGPYVGSLLDTGEDLELGIPQTEQLDSTVPYAISDRVNFKVEAPWPTTPQGTGAAMTRVDDTKYGNDPLNWVGATPSPGVANALLSLALQTPQKTTEGNTGITASSVFVVTLSGPSTKPVTITYTTTSGTATSGTDFTPQSGTLTFAPGQLSQLIPVPVVGDTTVEGSELFQVTISAPVGASITRGFATATITDDDVNALSWHNATTPVDVSGDTLINALDVLLMVNELNLNGTHALAAPAPPVAPPPYYDVNDDNLISPLDVVIVVNYINSHPPAFSASASAPLAVFADSSSDTLSIADQSNVAQALAAPAASAATSAAPAAVSASSFAATSADEYEVRDAALAQSLDAVDSPAVQSLAAADSSDELSWALDDELDGILADLCG